MSTPKIKSWLHNTGPAGVIVTLFLVCLAWLSLSRLALLALHWDRLGDVGSVWRIFPIGIRMDTILLCQLFALPVSLYLLLPGKTLRDRIVITLLTAFAAFIVHMELSTPNFIDEYDRRPDRIYYEYLLYPREVFGTLLKTYPLQLTIVALLVGAAGYGFWHFAWKQVRHAPEWPWTRRALLFPLFAILLFGGIRSSLGHRPANMSTAAFSNNHLANELAVSSAYSLFNAIYMTTKEVSADKLYREAAAGSMNWNETLTRVRKYSSAAETAFDNTDIPTLHTQTPLQKNSRPPNLVIVLMESLGADFIGSLGGLPLTPNIDKLSSEGLWFTQLYATGTRTVRGLEAVVTGFPPTAAPSVLKLPASQRDFYTLGRTLKQQGYATEFIYGGETNFDNMGKFFLENGFDRVIEQKDFKNAALLGTWGASDEDLAVKAHETFIAHGEKPFFALLLTTSNHVPFEFPAGRIELYEQPAATRNNAVKYTDYAIGKLLELARQAPYSERTIFLIVADHDARVFGADLVPVKRFHIPGVILGPNVPKRHETRIVSQIDLAPTLLSLMGIESAHPMLGRDMLQLPSDDPGRAMMQYADANAFMVGNRVAIHLPNMAAQTFVYQDGHLIKTQQDTELERDALAHLLWADRTYRERRYRLPEPTSR
jgi:phosphoglycerol transferase MdoB-like AlkP superfamily enzyme